MARPVVDPRFGVTLRRLRIQQGLSVRGLARVAVFGKSYVHDLESGRKQPSASTAARLDEILEAEGLLGAMVQPAPLAQSDQGERVGFVSSGAGRADAGTVDALGLVLAQHRRLEDVAGSAAMLTPTLATAGLVRALVKETTGSAVGQSMAGMASQWACYAGWLCTVTGRAHAGHAWYREAGSWAVRVGDADLHASAVQMLGHLAWVQGRLGDMIDLSRSAAELSVSPHVTAVAVQQEARGLALVGDARQCDERLGQAQDLAIAAQDHDGHADWLYFFDAPFLSVQRGLAHRFLGRHDSAVELLTAGLAGLSDELRRSEWIGWYVVRLAESVAMIGGRDTAAEYLEEADTTARRTGAARLSADIQNTARLMGM